MNDTLRQALQEELGERCVERDGTLVVSPVDERELARVLKILAAHGGRQHHGVTISRERFEQLGPIDVRSAVVEVGAGVPLERLEQELRTRDLSLGPLSPGAMALDVASFLEGPHAGLRVIPGGRLETACLALTGVMADGLRFASRASPRSAAGPDLDALFLGAEGRLGVLTGATLRAFPRPRSERLAVYSFPALEPALMALRTAVGQGCFLRRASISRRGGRWTLGVDVIGGPEAVERDLSTLGHCVFARGGRSSGQDVQFDRRRELPERELSWPELLERLRGGAVLTLWRVAMESVVVEGASEGGMPLVPQGEWPNADVFGAVAREADPQGILGGIA